MADKEPEEKDDFIELIKKLWSPIIGIIGAITSLINFYQLWLGNQATIIYIFAGGGFLLLLIALGWVGFSKKETPKRGNRKATKSVPRYSLPYRRAAQSILGILILLAGFSIYFLIQHRTAQENKLIVLIAEFEGPEEVYGLRNEIIENLNTDFSADENIEIISIDEIITISRGSEYVSELGNKYLADIVIWGWYRPTENPNINIHIENLSPSQIFLLNKSETFQPITNISELESFSFQQQTGDETSSIISFLAGIIEYQTENYEDALRYFDEALVTLPLSPFMFIYQSEMYLYRGNSKLFLGDYKPAIQEYDQALQIDSQYAAAYHNRGIAYRNLGELERAILDYDQALQIDPQFTDAYISRGIAYYYLDNYERAIQDYDQAIQIDPLYADAYYNRGIAYRNLGELERAIQDYDQAIQIDPQYAAAYNNRGVAYRNLGDLERAIQDYDQAIQIDPQLAAAFNNRGNAYRKLGELEHAIQDYDQAIQIDPLYAVAYHNRELAYQELGKAAEAEADFAKYKELTGQDAP